MVKHDYSQQGIKSSAQVLKAQKLEHTITLVVSTLGALIGALSIVFITIVLFEGNS